MNILLVNFDIKNTDSYLVLRFKHCILTVVHNCLEYKKKKFLIQIQTKFTCFSNGIIIVYTLHLYIYKTNYDA